VGARFVPETRDLDSEDAWQTLRGVQYLPLLKKSMQRFQRADGYSYARAIGFQVALAVFPALIFFVGVSVWTESSLLQSSVESIVSTLAPGSTGDFLQQAIQQGEQNARGNVWAIVLGGVAALTSGAVGMSQIQMGSGRLYGKDEDRGWVKRYAISLALSLSVGMLLAAAFVAIAFGSTIADAVEGESIWSALRWPLGAIAVVMGIAVLYKVAPNRNQPRISWLIVGGLTGTVLWLAFSGGLAAYLALSSTFGDTYGPLAGLMGLLIWAQLTGLALLSGIAFAAQLEEERARALDGEQSRT
jgi:YihY family inner membrane protein